MPRIERFSSRWAIVLAGLGMAVGTGNLWRFPRVAAQNGGAAFLIPWLIFLLTWSLPLLIAEFGLGRGARRGPVGAFTALVGRTSAWMGGFVVVTAVMIMFYYSVVTGWALKYAFLTGLSGIPIDPESYWNLYSVSIWQPVMFHVLAVSIGVLIVGRGVVSGIERANRVLIPLLFGLLVLAVTRAISLEGAGLGLSFLFKPDLSALLNYRTWLEALTQSAWSTGAGWGLILSYAVYVKRQEDVVTSSVAIGIGNNTASLLAAMAILPTVFAILPQGPAEEVLAAGNVGMTFVWIPQLFGQVSGGQWLLPCFFLALFFAALSSLIAMIELASRVFMDFGFSRRKAVVIVGAATCVCGIPSAVSPAVFENQDWVWGLALMISGLFISAAVNRYGAARFRAEFLKGSLDIGPSFDWVIRYFIPLQFVVMFGWWMYQAVVVYDPEAWWNPIRTYSLGTCLAQWGLVLLILIIFNSKLAAASVSAAKT